MGNDGCPDEGTGSCLCRRPDRPTHGRWAQGRGRVGQYDRIARPSTGLMVLRSRLCSSEAGLTKASQCIAAAVSLSHTRRLPCQSKKKRSSSAGSGQVFALRLLPGSIRRPSRTRAGAGKPTRTAKRRRHTSRAGECVCHCLAHTACRISGTRARDPHHLLEGHHLSAPAPPPGCALANPPGHHFGSPSPSPNPLFSSNQLPRAAVRRAGRGRTEMGYQKQTRTDQDRPRNI